MKQRTTIELSNKHKARLVAEAAQRGSKGYSQIIDEALELYFREEERRAKSKKSALALEGVLSQKDAEDLRHRANDIRNKWR